MAVLRRGRRRMKRRRRERRRRRRRRKRESEGNVSTDHRHALELTCRKTQSPLLVAELIILSAIGP